MSRLKLFIPVIIFAFLGITFYLLLGRNTSEIPSVLIDKTIPEFSLPSLYDVDKTLTAKDLKGKYALLNVWATWCPPCRAEHPFLLELAEQGIPIYGINWNEPNREDALNWLERLGDPYELVIYDAHNRLGIDLGVYGAPETFFDKSGWCDFAQVCGRVTTVNLGAGFFTKNARTKRESQ